MKITKEEVVEKKRSKIEEFPELVNIFDQLVKEADTRSHFRPNSTDEKKKILLNENSTCR